MFFSVCYNEFNRKTIKPVDINLRIKMGGVYTEKNNKIYDRRNLRRRNLAVFRGARI